MRTSVERLRIWLLVGAALLVAVIAGYLGYARYRIQRAIAGIPGRMGATITKEFNGYTWSQSDGKRTVLTIHASKVVQHTDGKYALHDVNMILYGHSGDRADHISGDDFEYDTANGVIRARGVVHLDLQAPVAPGTQNSEAAKHLAGASAANAKPDAGDADARPGSRIVHVKTSGLVYMQKLGIAATDEGIDFAFGGFTGHAIGAEYSSDTGHVTLQSTVTVSGIDHSRPVHLAAAHAELDRQNQLATLTSARYTSGDDTAQSEIAHIHLRTDGTAKSIEAERNVHLEQAGQGTVDSDRADLALDAANRPRIAVLTGNVRFTEDDASRSGRGNAARANLDFDPQGHIDHAVLHGGVTASERRYSSDTGQEPWSERTLGGETVELLLAPGEAKGKPLLRDAHASGGAVLTSVSTASKKTRGSSASVTTTSRVSADLLDAHFIELHGDAELSTAHGSGHTRLARSDSTGLSQTSSGDVLDARFRQKPDAKGAVEIATAEQDGNVAVLRTLPVRRQHPDARPEVQHATAKRAFYDADRELLTLSDDVQMSDESSTIWASRVVMNQDTGDAAAEGGVKVNYTQSGSGEPAHVVAARAELSRNDGRTTFFGSDDTKPGPGLARLWQAGTDGQGGSQIEAPVIVIEQDKDAKRNRLTARAASPGEHGTVRAVLVNKPEKAKTGVNLSEATDVAKAVPKKPGPAVVRIVSSMMVYSDLERQADFTGGVRLLDGDGDLRARQATVFLAPAVAKTGAVAISSSAPPATSGLLGGKVERIVATENVEIAEPGRRATGERLVYTASDEMYVLTGTPSAPPKVADAQQGTTTGATLRFHSGDNNVTVSGSDGDLPARRVHTETRVKK